MTLALISKRYIKTAFWATESNSIDHVLTFCWSWAYKYSDYFQMNAEKELMQQHQQKYLYAF